MADKCHATSRATRVLYTTAHVRLARARACTTVVLLFYTTCIRLHLEYACQLWDPYTSKSWLSLEAVQKFASKVCLKMWDLDYNTMLQLLNLPPLSVRREYLKLTAMYMAIHTTLPYLPTIPNFPGIYRNLGVTPDIPGI